MKSFLIYKMNYSYKNKKIDHFQHSRKQKYVIYRVVYELWSTLRWKMRMEEMVHFHFSTQSASQSVDHPVQEKINNILTESTNIMFGLFTVSSQNTPENISCQNDSISTKYTPAMPNWLRTSLTVQKKAH